MPSIVKENIMATNKRILLKSRPVGLPKDSDYSIVEEPIPTPGPDEIVIRNIYLSLDPAIRGWMDDVPSYLPPIPLGHVMRATTVGQVVASRSDKFKVGEYVIGLNGWEEYSLAPAAGFTMQVSKEMVPRLSNYLSILGAVGLTSYFGLLDVGKPKAGETVLVSGAAGAVGSLVGQIAKIKGCRAVGIAGSTEKCNWLVNDLGFDAAINYKEHRGVDALSAAIKAACPNGVDVNFENVGGDILDAALLNMNEYGRIPLCGMISGYNLDTPPVGQKQIWQLVVKSARLEGFLIKNYLDRFPEGITQMATWMAEGKLKHREDIVVGLLNTPHAFLKLFDGTNTGKLVVQVGEDN